jgi:DNA-binding transcriptional ArsR family regulator
LGAQTLLNAPICCQSIAVVADCRSFAIRKTYKQALSILSTIVVPDLYRLLGTKTKLALLRQLCTRPNRDWSVTELAVAMKLDKAQVSRALADIEKEGLITAAQRGPLKLCRLANDNRAEALKFLFNGKKRGVK